MLYVSIGTVAGFFVGAWSRERRSHSAALNALRESAQLISTATDRERYSPIAAYRHDDRPRVYLWRDDQQALNLYGQLSPAGQVPESSVLEEERERGLDGKASGSVVAFGGSRKRRTKAQTTYGAETDPTRALRALEKELEQQDLVTTLSALSDGPAPKQIEKETQDKTETIRTTFAALDLAMPNSVTNYVRSEVEGRISLEHGEAIADVRGYVRVEGLFRFIIDGENVTFMANAEPRFFVQATGKAEYFVEALSEKSEYRGYLFGVALAWHSVDRTLEVRPIGIHLA